MSDAEFWRLRLSELGALLWARGEAQKRDDFRFGLIASLIAQVAGDKHASPEKFFPALKPRRVQQSQEEQFRIMQALTLALGGTVDGDEGRALPD